MTKNLVRELDAVVLVFDDAVVARDAADLGLVGEQLRSLEIRLALNLRREKSRVRHPAGETTVPAATVCKNKNHRKKM